MLLYVGHMFGEWGFQRVRGTHFHNANFILVETVHGWTRQQVAMFDELCRANGRQVQGEHRPSEMSPPEQIYVTEHQKCMELPMAQMIKQHVMQGVSTAWAWTNGLAQQHDPMLVDHNALMQTLMEETIRLRQRNEELTNRLYTVS